MWSAPGTNSCPDVALELTFLPARMMSLMQAAFQSRNVLQVPTNQHTMQVTKNHTSDRGARHLGGLPASPNPVTSLGAPFNQNSPPELLLIHIHPAGCSIRHSSLQASFITQSQVVIAWRRKRNTEVSLQGERERERGKRPQSSSALVVPGCEIVQPASYSYSQICSCIFSSSLVYLLTWSSLQQ